MYSIEDIFFFGAQPLEILGFFMIWILFYSPWSNVIIQEFVRVVPFGIQCHLVRDAFFGLGFFFW